METIADRLRRAQERSGRSIRSVQQELHDSGVAGTSYANVHSYFQGKTQPSVAFLQEAAKTLEVRPAWLAFGEGEMDAKRQAAAAELGSQHAGTRKGRRAGRFDAVIGVLEKLPLRGVARDVIRDYCMEALDRDEVAESEALRRLIAERFPRTLKWSHFSDTATRAAILFGEAAAAYAFDFGNRTRPVMSKEGRD